MSDTTDSAKTVRFEGSPFLLHQPFPPAGDQPQAIEALVAGLCGSVSLVLREQGLDAQLHFHCGAVRCEGVLPAYTELLLSSVPQMDPDWLTNLLAERARAKVKA